MIDRGSDKKDYSTVLRFPLDYAYIIPRRYRSSNATWLENTQCNIDMQVTAGSLKIRSFTHQSHHEKNGVVLDRLATAFSYTTLKPRRPIIKRKERNCNNNHGDETTEDDKSENADGGISCSNMVKKSVTFADNRGLALAVVIEMKDISELSLPLSDTSLAAATEGEIADVVDEPLLILDFKQPASDYMTFRDRLERNFVSLENVILRDYNILGTIKVKNIVYDKRVFVRLTHDSWETFIDATACLAANTYLSTSAHSVFETFTFELAIPPNFNMKKTIEFAVCFEANGSQYWDNNGGINYRIRSTEWERRRVQLTGLDSVSELRECDSWPDFAAWDNVDTSLPYW